MSIAREKIGARERKRVSERDKSWKSESHEQAKERSYIGCEL